MTQEEKLDRLDAVFAFDSGCKSSGIDDPLFKAHLKSDFTGTMELLKRYVSSILGKPEYGFEDIAYFVKWVDEELGFDF